MFANHVTRNISSYCNGELSAEESHRFNEHLLACPKCRSQYDQIKLGVKFAEQLPRLSAPQNLWSELETKLIGVTPRRQWTTTFYVGSWQARIAAAVLIGVLGGLGLWLVISRQPMTNTVAAWPVQRLDGTPRIDSKSIQGKGQLAVGQWLETDGNSRAQISVASIGQVEIDSNTRVRLLQTQPTEHRLELARGKMSARIWAPPRLFFVDTPSAVAADLGCAYTLEVDEAGASLLRVTSGWVALELKDLESMVPAGAACQTRPSLGPGTPYFEDAVPEFRQALTKIDFNGDSSIDKSAVDVLLKNTRSRDTLTLWHLLERVNTEERMKIYDRIASFVPPPAGVTKEGILRLDRTMLDDWREQLEPTWAVNTSIPKKVAEAYWRVKNGITRRVNK